MGRVTARTPARRVIVGGLGGSVHADLGDNITSVTDRPDTVTVEEPLQIRVAGSALTVTMRTPGDDFDLTMGFLITEGLIEVADDVQQMMHCNDEGSDGSPTYNVVDVSLRAGIDVPSGAIQRSFAATSACGVCGKTSIDAVRIRSPYDLSTDQQQILPQVLISLPSVLRERQKVFDRTGGLHAAGLFTADGELLVVREDIGRHNAVDKLIGWAAREKFLPLRSMILLVSGRVSFELTQKALMAGIPCLAAVSAPSSLAIDLAKETGMTLIGFLRSPRMTVYTDQGRLLLPLAT